MVDQKETAEYFFGRLLSKYENLFQFIADEECKLNTPKRLSKMYLELLRGYKENPKEILEKRFLVDRDDMIIIKDISFVSLCEHHWLPFFGTVHIGYIPKKVSNIKEIREWINSDEIETDPKKIEQYYRDFDRAQHIQYEVVGMSKIPRIVQCFAKRFQLQERMTNQIADAIFRELNCPGCIVISKAQHLCSKIRGVKNDSEMCCSAIRGEFEKPELKNEFMNLLRI